MNSSTWRINDSAVRCPLCLEFFVVRYDEARKIFILACDADRVAIAIDDPFVGKWDQALDAKSQKIECPNCNADMRYFATSTGFMKAVCPKKSCGATMSNAEPDRDTHRIATPDNPGMLQ